MPNYSALAIANEFLRRRRSPVTPAQMQLQKLVFNAHGWNLAINNEPLVFESAQAWDNGPVFRTIWNHVRDYGHGMFNQASMLIDPLTRQPFAANLSPAEAAIVDETWSKYGAISGIELSQMTHRPNTPWYKAYFNRGRNSALSDRETAEYYRQLAAAGRTV